MNASGNTTRRAPAEPASLISEQALSVVASRSRNTGAACTAAIVTVIASHLAVVSRGHAPCTAWHLAANAGETAWRGLCAVASSLHRHGSGRPVHDDQLARLDQLRGVPDADHRRDAVLPGHGGPVR